jgi:hypothetical protein
VLTGSFLRMMPESNSNASTHKYKADKALVVGRDHQEARPASATMAVKRHPYLCRGSSWSCSSALPQGQHGLQALRARGVW